MNNALYFLTALTAVGSGVVGGVLFAFSSFIMRALARLTPEQGIAAMQSINITVINPLSGILFLGTALTSVFLIIVSLTRFSDPGSIYLLAGSLLYVVAILITGAFNVPLNNELASVQPSSSVGAELWAHFIPTWTKWNHVRTLACIGSSALLIISLSKFFK
ncbi:DUF1772 domain-containing protein [Paenibacillus sp. GSMTC-2017]|uniref:anthrone oxygenase family protein n=1 Tax=Paenibacillus sp. GSMTC-2017 TaxID=2794350 RepID=UPI0018D83D37|nr:anthrone oxygenase family protein [Paenibacillus sp. GSMTC-2017]MBH5319574.1 DUF1772 domain-containing protein [Paenibacillus sp. GSMTC-2017]